MYCLWVVRDASRGWHSENSSSDELVQVLLPMMLDATTENMADFAVLTLEQILESSDGDKFQTKVYYEALRHIHELYSNHATSER